MGKFLFIFSILSVNSFVTAHAQDTAWHVDALKYNQLDKKYDGTGVIVAVIDSGVDYTHDALKNKMWHNPNEIPLNGIDDDANGFVDDYYGYNFHDELNHDPMDFDGHGTHCAGLIAADKDPESNAQGIAPGARIMALKIGYNDNDLFLTNVARAIHYAVDHGAKILSNSWSFYNSPPSKNTDPDSSDLKILGEAIQYAESHGVIFVNLAGNAQVSNRGDNLDQTQSYTPLYPLAIAKGLSNYLTVAASSFETGKQTLAYFSNYGAVNIDVAAPGEHILSTYSVHDWQYLDGTSMATPIVAGLLARGLSKGYTWQQALQKLKATANTDADWKKVVTYGVVDPVKFLK